MSESEEVGVFRSVVSEQDPRKVRELVAATDFFYEHEVVIAQELVEETLAKGLDAGYQFLFVDQGDRLLGYACFGEIPCTVGSYDLYWIAVAPNCQRAGWGRKLMEEVERRVILLGGKRVYIDTSGRAQYSSTRSFYERCGYKREAELIDFYGPGDSKQVFSKALS